MAQQGRVQLITEMMMQDSDFQAKAKKVEQQLSKLSTSQALIKMKLDDTDFRKQIQAAVAEAEKAVRKAYGAKVGETVTYRNAKGNTTKIDTEASMRKASQFALEQSVNKGLTTAEQNAWRKRYDALEEYLKLLGDVRTASKSAAREMRAVESGRIQSVRQQSARQNNQEENARRRILQLEKDIAKERARHTRGGGQWVSSLYKQINLYHELEASAKKAGDVMTQQYARRMITSLNQQADALEKVNGYYGKQRTIVNGLRNLMYRYVSIYSVARFGEKVAETTGYFQQQQVALEGILGSASKATAVLNEIKNFALQSPFQTKDLVTFTKQLAAFGVGSNDLFPTVKKLADISAGLGVDMGRIILAFGQVRSAAVLRGQELRQFTEAGIPLVEELSKRFTALNGTLVTTGEVFKLISERKVSFEMVADVLSSMTAEGGKFYKMQENITNTTYGQIQKLKDLWTIALDDMGKDSSGFINGIIKGLQYIVKNIGPVAAAVASLALATGLGKAWTAVVQLGRAFKSAAVAARLFGSSLFATLSGGIGALVGIAGGIIYKVFKDVNELDKRMAQVADSFAKDTKKMTDGLDSLATKITKAKVGTKEYNEAVDVLAQNYGAFVGKDIIEKLKGEANEAGKTADAFRDLAEGIKSAIESYNDYLKLEKQEDAAKEVYAKNAEKEASTFKAWISNNNLGQSDEIKQDYKDRYGRDASNRDLRRKFAELFKSSISDFAAGDVMTKKEFERILTKSIKEQFPSISEGELSSIVKLGVGAAFNSNVGLGLAGKNFQSILDKQQDIKASEYYGIHHFFDAVDKGSVRDTGDAIDYAYDVEANYVKALHDTLLEKLGENGLAKELETALKGAYKVMDDGKVIIDKFDSHTVNTIEKLFEDFRQTFSGNPDMMNWLEQVGIAFSQNVSSATGRTADVRKKIEGNGYYRTLVDDEATRSLWARYNPSDKTYNTLRSGLKGEYDALVQELDSYVKKNEAKDLPTINSLRQRIKAMEVLASPEYYNVDLTKKTGGAGSEYDIEISELVSNMKEAYEVYKKATQAEGADMGLAYMQNDKKMQERFADYFHGWAENLFKNEKGEDIKIGKSGQTIRELLKDTFIDSGIENGVIDFEKAIRKVGEAMIEYGKQNEKARKGFISAGKAYVKYADQISKDNVTAWIAEMNKQFADLGKTFERTSQQVELYRGLMRNGTADQLGRYAGVGSGTAMTPDSVRNAGNIKQMMALYNKLLREEASKNLKEGETLDESKLHYLSIDKLGSVGDIQQAIATVTERMKLNKDNFGLGTFGEAGTKLEALLQNQLGIIIKELQSISSDQYTGDNLADAIANAQTKVKTAIDITRSQEMVNKLYGGDHGAAMKGRMDATFAAMQSIFDEFLKSNNFEAMSQATRFFTNKDGSQSSTEIWGAAGIDIEKLKEKFRKIVDNVDDNILKDELEKKFRDLELKVLEFNAAGGDLGAIHDNMQLYRGAHQEAVDRYESYKAKQTVLGNQIEAGGYANAQGQFVRFSPEETEHMVEELAACNEELVKMGENGINFEKSLKGAALKNIQASIGKASQGLNVMQDAVMGVINAASSLAKAVNKVYDVMNDGENPAWMQDMEGFLEDFGEAFQMLIAPIAAVIAMIMALAIVSVTAEAMMTPLLIVMLAIIAAALIVAAIVAAFQQHDRALQRDIENLEKQIEDTQNAIKNLEAAAQRMSGFRKLNTQIQALSKNFDIYKDKLKQAALEEEKKNTDNDKVKEYKQGAQEALDEFLNSLQDATDEVTGSVQDWASSLSEALRSAFQNGENAARAFRNTAIEMVGDIVNKIIEMTVLEPMIESAIQGLLGYSLDKNSSNYIGAQDRFKNSDGSINSQKLADYVTGQLSNDNAEGIYQFLKAVEGGYGRVIDFINNDLAKPLKEAWAYNSDTSELSGGIQGITEDTARTLEGLANSQLAQLVLIQRSVLALESSGFAQVQTSWFNDMLTQQRAIRIATEGVSKAIEDMRNGIRPMNVTMS